MPLSSQQSYWVSASTEYVAEIGRLQQGRGEQRLQKQLQIVVVDELLLVLLIINIGTRSDSSGSVIPVVMRMTGIRLHLDHRIIIFAIIHVTVPMQLVGC